MKVGEILTSERERRGLSLNDVEDETKIRTKYLAALEEEDYREIPGTVYVIGFLRNYARYLDLDPDEILGQYHAQNPVVEENGVAEPDADEAVAEKQTRQRRHSPQPGEFGSSKGRNRVLYAVIAIVALIAVFWAVNALNGRKQAGPQTQTTPKSQTQQTAPAKPKQQQQQQQQQTAVEGVTVVLTCNEACWTRATVDGELVLEKTLPAGTAQTFKGNDSVTLRIGNPKGVTLTYNGQNVPSLGTKAITKTFTKP
jgi:cytoskeleton protein RodZ